MTAGSLKDNDNIVTAKAIVKEALHSAQDRESRAMVVKEAIGKKYSDLQMNIKWGRRKHITSIYKEADRDVDTTIRKIRQFTDIMAVSEKSGRESNFSLRSREYGSIDISATDDNKIIIKGLGRRGLIYDMQVNPANGTAVITNCTNRS